MTPTEIRSAHARIRAHIRCTPLLEVPFPREGDLPLVSLKLECLQDHNEPFLDVLDLGGLPVKRSGFGPQFFDSSHVKRRSTGR